jgi:dihydrofolate synthase/folylpolyglutamate synthase
MTAALLEAHGLSAGACVSPHATRWSERTLVHGREIGAAEFAAAAETVARAAESVDRAAGEEGPVTQFEVATAISFVALANARVKAGVIEAGLGGRLDATNTIPSRVTVLTSVGLDHTEWLGDTELEIAAEKLAVLRDHTTLVLGSVSLEVEALAERVAAERAARLVRAAADPGAGVELRAAGPFQRRNFALAAAAAEAFLGSVDAPTVAAVAAEVSVPGRLERIADEPPTFIDAAHNPDGAAALAEALSAIRDGRPAVACLAVLADKDAARMIEALAPELERAVCTELPPEALASHGRPGASSRPAAELAGLCEAAGVAAETEPGLAAALGRARAAARERGAVLVVTGSHYLLEPARQALCEDSARGPQRPR